jgi:hypothetical protein
MKLPAIIVNRVRTPTAVNRECEWSVGLMNLTQDEAICVVMFAADLEKQRSGVVTSGTYAVRIAPPPLYVTEPKPKPEQKNGNRFSGLDLEIK